MQNFRQKYIDVKARDNSCNVLSPAPCSGKDVSYKSLMEGTHNNVLDICLQNESRLFPHAGTGIRFLSAGKTVALLELNKHNYDRTTTASKAIDFQTSKILIFFQLQDTSWQLVSFMNIEHPLKPQSYIRHSYDANRRFITGAQSRYTRLHFCQLVLHASLLYFFVMVLLILVFVHLFRYHFVTYQVDDVIICDATVSTAGSSIQEKRDSKNGHSHMDKPGLRAF